MTSVTSDINDVTQQVTQHATNVTSSTSCKSLPTILLLRHMHAKFLQQHHITRFYTVGYDSNCGVMVTVKSPILLATARSCDTEGQGYYLRSGRSCTVLLLNSLFLHDFMDWSSVRRWRWTHAEQVLDTAVKVIRLWTIAYKRHNNEYWQVIRLLNYWNTKLIKLCTNESSLRQLEYQ